ncbi:hypothetical protein FRC09_001458 [Ceratobasidium sp. 395]|nr:hypothetical protein FRC09_001458 [Ceratobasidium sp. 395]
MASDHEDDTQMDVAPAPPSPIFTAPNPQPDQPPLIRHQTKPPTMSKGAFRVFPEPLVPRPQIDPNPRPLKRPRPREYEEDHSTEEAKLGNSSTSRQDSTRAPKPSVASSSSSNLATWEAGLIEVTRQLATPPQPQPNAPLPPPPPPPQPSSPPTQSNAQPPPQSNPPQPPQPNLPQANPPQPDPPRPAPPQSEPALAQPAPSQPAPSQPAPSQPAPPRPNPPQPNPPQPAPPQPAPSHSGPSGSNPPRSSRHAPSPDVPRASGPRLDAMDTDGDADDEGSGGPSTGGGARDVNMQELYRMMAQIAEQQEFITQNLKNNTQQADQDSAENADSAERSEKRRRISPPSPRKATNWDQSVLCLTPAGRQPREMRRTLILGIVRKAVAKLLGHTDKKKPLPPSPPTNVLFPTLQSFYIRWEESEKSIFNCLATGIVADYIKADWAGEGLTDAEVVDLTPMVSEHIRYLCQTVRRNNKPDAAMIKKKNLKRASASSRRKTLYESRLKVIDRFPVALGKHRNLFVQLGIDGTSSDKEDPANKGVFLVKRRPELSSNVVVLKSKVDVMYKLLFKGDGTRGSQLHARQASDLVSTRRYIPAGLPVSCLSRTWYKSLTQPEREFYGFSDHKYDFAYADDLYARKAGRQPEDVEMSEDEDDGDVEL